VTILISGINGFVGKNLRNFLCEKYQVKPFSKDFEQSIDSNFFIHLAGKAHVLNENSNSNEYYEVNTDFTKKIFDKFLESKANVFITLSTVKAVAENISTELTEEDIPNPLTHYGKSKLLAEDYILSKNIPEGKRVYILRPCMIHGPGNKGNLNLLYKIVASGLPWPLVAFENRRSFCSIDNLMFIINELIERDDIPSGVYNIADDEAISTNELITILAQSFDKTPKMLYIPRGVIKYFVRFGDMFNLPITTERLHKLTQSYVVSNEKIKSAIGKQFPISSKDGLLKTFNYFKNNVE
jgi:nucleoside-diphosphate-sugar epimerase